LSKPLGASGALFEDIAQPSNARIKKQVIGKKPDALFIRILLRET
jgi:hypothetical protein